MAFRFNLSPDSRRSVLPSSCRPFASRTMSSTASLRVARASPPSLPPAAEPSGDPRPCSSRRGSTEVPLLCGEPSTRQSLDLDGASPSLPACRSTRAAPGVSVEPLGDEALILGPGMPPKWLAQSRGYACRSPSSLGQWNLVQSPGQARAPLRAFLTAPSGGSVALRRAGHTGVWFASPRGASKASLATPALPRPPRPDRSPFAASASLPGPRVTAVPVPPPDSAEAPLVGLPVSAASSRPRPRLRSGSSPSLRKRTRLRVRAAGPTRPVDRFSRFRL